LISLIAPKGALRHTEPGQTPHVTPMELFFDLVYVLTIIQLSHYLLAHLSLQGALEALVLFAGVWWTWNYTAWAANWVNPNHQAGRLLFVVLMACALLMAIAIPAAYAERGLLFALAYVSMALIRAGYMALLFRGEVMGRNYAQLFCWSALSSALWLAGALLPEHRLMLWAVAVLVDYAAPYAGFWVPGFGATPMSSWTLKGLHLLERNQLIFIIALGESILLLGGKMVYGDISALSLGTAGVGFLIIVTLWFLYFHRTSEDGEQAFEDRREHTELARAGLAYAHGIMVCGAIVCAVLIESILANPLDAVTTATVAIAAAGPVLFLLGSLMFRRSMGGAAPMSYWLTIIAIVGLCVLAQVIGLAGLWLGSGVLGLLIVLAIVTSRSGFSSSLQT